MSERFEPRQRTAIDGRTWWVVYDNFQNKYSTCLLFGKYKTKKECKYEIDKIEKLCGKSV